MNYCNICLDVYQTHFKEIDNLIIDMLKTLFLKLDLTTRNVSAICDVCLENVRRCYDFKSMCLRTENSIKPFMSNQDTLVNLQEIYLNKPNKTGLDVIPEGYSVCRLCIDMVKLDDCVNLNGESKDVTLLKVIFIQFFSELNFDNTENPLICSTCHTSLRNYFNFVSNSSGLQLCCKITEYELIRSEFIMEVCVNNEADFTDSSRENIKRENRDESYQHSVRTETKELVLKSEGIDIDSNELKSESFNDCPCAIRAPAVSRVSCEMEDNNTDMDMQIPSTSAVGNNDENIGQLSKKSVCECVVCVLIIKGFSSINVADKLQLISKGRAKPPMKNLTTKMKDCIRHFYPEKHYEQFKWLTGCENISKLFCWPCLLFQNEKGLWNKTGFSDLNNLHKAVKRHVMSKAHLQAIIKEKVFGKTRIEHALNKQLEISHRQHNELVDKNRQILKRLIDVVCFLGQHELGFRGHDETRVSSNRGNFQDLLSLMAKYDDCLKNHLEQFSVFCGTPNRIQNDLISAVATIILKRIKQEIGEARFIAIVLDETTDITNFSQLSIVIRYVKTDGSIQERFLGFKNVSENRTADALYTVVYNVTKELNGDKKLVAQSYDGAAVMAGQLGGLQAKVRKTFPNALFVHCFAHKLNLVLSQSINHIKECKVFFVTLSGMAAFFSKSTKRTQALDSIVHKRLPGLPKVALTRWNYNGRLVLTVSENRESLIELFEDIIENNETWDSEAINSSRGFLDCLKRNFKFNFLLNIFSEIFPFSDNVFNILQTKTNDIAFCLKKVADFKSILSRKRDDFDLFWEKTMTLNVEPQAKRLRTDRVGDVQTSYRCLFYEIIDQIQQQINYRFNGLNDFKFLELCNFDAFKGNTFPEDAFKSLLLHYGQFFDRVLLRSELKVIYETDDISAKNNAKELLEFLKDNELEDAYTEVSKLCELVLTIPATSSSVERNFSTLKRIKNFVRNSTEQERFSQISLLFIENKLLQNMSEHRRFYDDVIDEFAKSDQRIELHYKEF